MDQLRLAILTAIGVTTLMLTACESSSDKDSDESTTDASENRSFTTKESDDASVDEDASGDGRPIAYSPSDRCLSDEDCDGNYCCPLFHYCVERCDELEEPCSQPNFFCKQGYSEPLCWYVGPTDPNEERTPSEGGGPCVLDEDCLAGYFCAPTLRFCVERCDEEGETCPSTGNTCSEPNAYDVFQLPMLACVYQEGDSEGAGGAVETEEVTSASQEQKRDACDCMFSSEVYPDPSRLDACTADVSDKCVACLEDVVEDTSTCDSSDVEAVLSCTDPCSRAVPPPETVQECKDFLLAVGSPLPVEETDCICENCTDWYNLCLVDPDCTENLACMFENNCLGFDCMTPCEAIRNRLVRNNPDSINISAQVAHCSVEFNCR
jgi:hypothetical protein